MNTTDQTFIRAYGSDFVPSYADEAARDADYPALADCNVNAVFGSLPRPHQRVDGPSATSTAAAPQAQGHRLPAPLPARPYMPRLDPAHGTSPAPQGASAPHIASALQAASTLQGVPTPEGAYAPPGTYAPRQRVHLPPATIQETVAPPVLTDDEASGGSNAIELPPMGRQSEHSIEPAVGIRPPHDDVNEDALPPRPAPVAARGGVPRPHFNIEAVKEAEPQSADIAANAEPPHDLSHTPQPAIAAEFLGAENGLAVWADSSVLIGSSHFEWPNIDPAGGAEVKHAPPTVAPEILAEKPQVAKAPEILAEEPEVAKAPEILAEEPEVAETQLEPAIASIDKETPPGPAITNIDKEAAGAAMEAEANAPVAARQKLKPAWEVDHLLWPADSDRLYESEAEYFRHAGEKLRDASHEGLRVLGVSSTYAGEGCTTLAICLARAAAAAGAKVALVDANLRSPSLGTSLGLDFARSWHETLDGETALAEAAVTAIDDNVTLIPLSKNAVRQGLRLDSDDVNDVLGQARETFDLVLVDIGWSSDDDRYGFQGGDACPLDAAIIVRDVRATSEAETLKSASRFRALGIDAVGIAENFAASAVARAAA